MSISHILINYIVTININNDVLFDDKNLTNCFHANKTAGMTDNQGSGYRRNERKSPVFEEEMNLGMTDLKQRQEI